MKTYKLKDDLVNGVLPNNQPNIIFKKGDIIQGEQIEKFVFNTMTKGINAKPTVLNAKVEKSDGLVFVPLSRLEIIINLSDNIGVSKTMEAIKNNGNITKLSNTFLKEHKNYLLLIVGAVAGYLLWKKIK